MIGQPGFEPASAAGTLLLILLFPGCGETDFSEGYLEATARRTQNQVTNEVRLRARQLAPTVMRVDLTDASERERRLLDSLLRAAGLANEIFWRQTSHLAVPYRAQVQASYPRDHIVREFYLVQMGPYDRLDDDRAYLDVPPRSPGGGFYPPDLTADEFRSWLETHPGDREEFRDPYTVIRRQGEDLVAIPYHREYRDLVEPMAAALREAASHADDPRLERVLELKARAVLGDEHFAADTAWVRLDDARFEVILGPHGTREDRLLNLKAAYQASVALVDSAASAELDRYRRHLEGIRPRLPYPDSLKSDSTDPEANVTVVRDIYRGGLIGTGEQPVAARLPNEPGARSTAGTRTIVWKNVVEARFDSIIRPIGRAVLAEDQREALSSAAYYRLVVVREMARGLGPRRPAERTGREPVAGTGRDLPRWVEMGRADLVGLLAMKHLTERGVLDREVRTARLASQLASLLRSLRFGTDRAGGRAALISLNWFLQHGGISYDSAAARYRVRAEAMGESTRTLAEELMMIEATGDRERAERLYETYGRRPASLEPVLSELGHLPMDVVPLYRIRW